MNPILPFLMAGDPSLESLPALLLEAHALGIEALEVGLPIRTLSPMARCSRLRPTGRS